MRHWQPAFGQYWVTIGRWAQISDQSDLVLMPDRQVSRILGQSRAEHPSQGRSLRSPDTLLIQAINKVYDPSHHWTQNKPTGIGDKTIFQCVLLFCREVGDFLVAFRRNGGPEALVGLLLLNVTSVFNADASLPYTHDLFESLIVKKRVKVDGEGTYCLLNTIIPRCLYLQTFTQPIWIKTDNKNATDIGWQPYLVVSPTRHSEDHAVPILEGEVGHLSVYATLNWAWKTALSSANDGSAYATHVPTNATSGFQ
ncbi:hypothetical protein T265_04683 [Opisthorchis viverrini]|uniref:Uncharacterized protein n=1 Tax=Opisthorchis viverrini TaxID=6198 RepID=A0A075AG70_OPIVI|nr:hypothetical protein T265_04683 [Opisthorchis viverrini]KER28454.1 hypothetical protein T265_04683 [Opisthorchis viverrini]